MATEMLTTLEINCMQKQNGCEWYGQYDVLSQHMKKCTIHIQEYGQSLLLHIKEMRRLLDIEINPHLRECHTHIYDTYVRDWEFLGSTKKEWKWWWWAHNDWWENKPCPECNVLWHKYED
jgi:hypothetical protein